MSTLWLELWGSQSLRTVASGAVLLGVVAGAVGSFAVLRRQSLLGDAVSHAALPGVALAFLCGAREPAWLVLGAAASGWLAMVLVGVVVRNSRVPFDAALGGALAVFFGLGLVLMTWLMHHRSAATSSALERYLFGQAALMRNADLHTLMVFGGLALALLFIFWKPLKILVFDPDYAAVIGLPVRALDLLLTTLIVVGVVIGLQAVGVVLMTALLVAPAAAARQWTNRLGGMVLLAGAFGGLAGFSGTVLSHALHALTQLTFATGPTIVICASLIVFLSLFLGSSRGLLWSWWRQIRQPQTAPQIISPARAVASHACFHNDKGNAER